MSKKTFLWTTNANLYTYSDNYLNNIFLTVNSCRNQAGSSDFEIGNIGEKNDWKLFYYYLNIKLIGAYLKTPSILIIIPNGNIYSFYN